MDMTASIEPRSDQVNADDLLTGPRTVTIERVTVGAAEQPWDFHLVEIPGRVYRPSKSMLRVIIAAWGSDSEVCAGRRLTLYREPSIRFGKDEVGGIRISHMSHIAGPLKLALTVSRGKRDPFTVQPLADTAPTIPPATPEQIKQIGALLGERGITERADLLAYISTQVNRTVTSSKDLNRAEASALIGELGGGA